MLDRRLRGFLICSYNSPSVAVFAAVLKGEAMQRKLSRKEVNQALETVPLDQLFSIDVSKGLTHKQKTFAREVARGATKAEAYRRSYKSNAAPSTIVSEPYAVARNPLVSREIEAYKLALAAQEYQSPAALRALVIQSLVQVVIDPDAKQATKVAAAKVLGTVTEVAAFTTRAEVTTIKHSVDAKAQVLEHLRALMRAQSIDAVDVDADSLLAELDPHPPATPPNASEESLYNLHTIPHKPPEDPHEVSQNPHKPPQDFLEPTQEEPDFPEHPPLSSEQKEGGGI
jgi:hypothetical protein